MSYENYKAAMEAAKNLRFYTTAGGCSDESIRKSEDLLGIKFSSQYRDFNKHYGYLSFFGCEIFGADPEDLEIAEGNSVACALSERRDYGLPSFLLPIYNFDDGCMAYLDHSSLNEAGEPRVVMKEYAGSGYELVKVLDEDFGDFVLHLVREAEETPDE